MKVSNYGVDHPVAVVRGRVSGVAATGTSTISEIGLISITPPQLTADTDDWNPTGLSTASIIRASSDAAWNLTGITAPAQDVLLILENIGTFNITLVHNATSTAGNRFLCPGDVDLVVGPDNGIWLAYDGTSNRWRIIGGAGGGSGGSGSLSQERFVAAGGTPETFTLADTPVTVICFVNGVEQDPSAVGISGADVDVNTTAGDIVVIVYTVASASAASGLLAIVEYRPGSDAATYSTSSASLVAVDGTNLTITFTAPASGNVLVKLTGANYMGTTSNFIFWGLLESATPVGSGTQGVSDPQSGLVIVTSPASFYITGLTPGSSHTYDWAWATSGATGYMYGGPTFGSFTMEVWSAP